MDNVNLELTRELLEKNKDRKTFLAIMNRNKEAFKTFCPWIAEPFLDIGCREGMFLRLLGDCKKYGVDISEEAISFVDTGIVADAEALPFADESFMTVGAFHVIEHCRNTEKAIREIHRVLKKGGHALVEIPLQKKESVPTKWGHWYCFETEQEILNTFSFLFKKIEVFKKIDKPWRRIVFKKE